LGWRLGKNRQKWAFRPQSKKNEKREYFKGNVLKIFSFLVRVLEKKM
jgi:hypothetical protein